jgi:DNA-binding GntR family transcriptional regulator
MPPPPVDVQVDGPLVLAQPSADDDASPYRRIAADLRAAIRCGALKEGDYLPTLVEIAERYEVAAGTAHRALAVLADEGRVAVSRGRRAVVLCLVSHDG